MRVYVACLSAYNNGQLHGEWIDVSPDVEAMQEAINDMLELSPQPHAEEWAIHDHEGFGSLHLSEYTPLVTLAEYAEFYADHEELGLELLAHFNDISETIEAIENHYHGEYDSEEDFAIKFTEETGMEIPKHLAYYIDYAAMARDYFINDFYSIETGSTIHVFSHY